MKHHYRDIRDKLGEPLWWDEVGTPRYCEFGPGETNNIYAVEVAFLEIACQNCGRRFKVAMSWGLMDKVMRHAPTTSARVRDRTIHYGDPPNSGCCPAGASMNSIPITVLEFWQIEAFDKKRLPELEGVDLTPEWAEG